MLTGFVFVSIMGSLFHFLYNWSGENFFVGLFTAVNESTWEHMKLLFFPMILYCLLASLRNKRRGHQSYPCADALGILAGTLLIPIIFYTYTGILGYHVAVLDIGTFLLSVFLAFRIRENLSLPENATDWNHCCRRMFFENRKCLLSLIFIVLFFLCFLIFTYRPPVFGLFQDPTNTSFSFRVHDLATSSLSLRLVKSNYSFIFGLNMRLAR